MNCLVIKQGGEIMGNEHEPLTLTVEETAALLRISRGKCYEAVRQGEIPSLKFGRTIRIPRFALQNLLRKYTAEDRDSSADM